MKKKVLVTGGAGFIGSHTVDELIAQGYSVRVYDNLNPQVHGERAEKPDFLHPDAEFIKGDVRDRDHLHQSIKDVDLIIHDAAEVGVGQSMYSIDQYISTKTLGGTGIGLHMSRSVITKIEGLISAINTDNGVCFTIILPISSVG